jgi:superfamily II DNA or RNA helicase
MSSVEMPLPQQTILHGSEQLQHRSQHIQKRRAQCLDAYRANPLLVTEHANIERATAQGGYGRRQLYELVQNGADAILGTSGTKIHVLLTKYALYCANEGAPIDCEGIDSILHSSMSAKRNSEIGRFGLGFKSVLGVTSRPQFFSRAGSFGFDEEWAKREILAVFPEAMKTPVLRLAFPLDLEDEVSKDRDLAQLMDWAESVVRLPLSPDALPLLQDDIEAFPSEFVLFCPHVQLLELEDRSSGFKRQISISSFGNDLLLEETNPRHKAKGTSKWRVFHKMHRPSSMARRDAGELAEREVIPITWAVPLEGRPGSGQFWAFFPTEYETTLSGIVNAPWKTNEDRQNLLRGDFNNELLSATAELVVDSLQELTPAAQPGAVLDYLPGRLKEEKNWADAAINENVYQLASLNRCLPDQDGILRPLNRLKVGPPDLPDKALALWADHPQRPAGWCHHSCESRERRSRVDRLLNYASTTRSSLREWLESLAGANATGSGAACQIATVLKDLRHPTAGEVLQSNIVLTTEGRCVRPLPGKVFLPGITPADGTAVTFVHPTLNNFVPFRTALLALGITALNAKEQLSAFLKAHNPLSDVDLRVFWELACLLPVSDVVNVLRTLQIRPTSLRVKTLGGSLKRLDEVLLPGEIVGTGNENANCAVDTSKFGDLQLLNAMGARSAPEPERVLIHESWFGEYRQEALEAFFRELGTANRPQLAYLAFDETTGVGPLAVLKDLEIEAAARFTESVLAHPLSQWTFKHSTRELAYPMVSCPNPALWFIWKHGALRTSLGARLLKDCVGPNLRRFGAVLPVADCSDQTADDLQLAQALKDIPQHLWSEGLNRCSELQNDDDLGLFYAAAAQYSEKVPDKIRCTGKSGPVLLPPSHVVVVRDRKTFEDFLRHGISVLMVNEGADVLLARWSLKRPEEALKTAVHPVPLGLAQPLGDKYPLLRLWADDKIHHFTLQMCESIRLEVFRESGRTESQIDFHFDGTTAFATSTSSSKEILRQICATIDLDLDDAELDNLVKVEQDDKRDHRKNQVLSESTPADRFLRAVGRSSIKSKLPTPLLQAVETEAGRALEDGEMFKLADAVYGVELLRVFRDELENAGLQPPVQWAGSFKARRFVRELGFPLAYAGFESANREPLVRVNGPPKLPQLHDFQRSLTQSIRGLLGRQGGSRGLLSLPTGAGKTRVTVQAIVEQIRDAGFASPVLWIAQSDELCEQAVQTWTEVWRALGSRNVLSISRLWSSNEAEAVENGPHVVVATVDKLRGCVEEDSYSWLSEASCVVVDEAHTAIAPEYTYVLEWLGLTRRGDRCPLLGLTATPFRGRSIEETERLVARYGRRRLDAGILGDDPYQLLQQIGVLAKVRHKLLAGISVDLSADELSQLRTTGSIPSSVRERIGADVGRNQQLLKSIETLPEDWPILLFSSSVSHAQTMAALLNMQGIRAAAVSSETDPAVRRHYIDEFRRGSIRALTNYGVLTQGFDAPAVRAIYVARPTYSPNVYQQMIGRGLRGPKNGGKDECLIINVADNLLQYGEKLAFTQFEYLWSSDSHNAHQ